MKTLNGKLITLLFLLTGLYSCQQKWEEQSTQVDEPEYAKEATEEEIEEGDADYSTKDYDIIQVQNETSKRNKAQKIIKTAQVQFQVENLNKSIQNIQRAIQKTGAYISSANQHRDYNALRANIAIRVDRQKFENLLTELLKESVYLDMKNVQAQDVGEEFFDLQTRLKTKKKVEERFHEILEKAQSIEEILKVENQIRVLREEIEAKEGRLKFLKDQVRYSTINLEIYERIEGMAAPEISFFSKAGKSFHSGWKGLLNFILGIIYLWPGILILGVLLWLVRRIIRNRQSSK